MPIQGNRSMLNVFSLSKVRNDLRVVQAILDKTLHLVAEPEEKNILLKSLFISSFASLESALGIIFKAVESYDDHEGNTDVTFNKIDTQLRRLNDSGLSFLWNEFLKFKSLRNKFAHDSYGKVKLERNQNDIFFLLNKYPDSLAIVHKDGYEELTVLSDEFLVYFLNLSIEFISLIKTKQFDIEASQRKQ